MALIEPDALVKAAMEAVGTSSPTELARAVGLTGYSDPRNITRWIEGENAPGYEATLLLLRAAGMLNLEAPAPPSTAPSGSDAILEAVRALDRKLDVEVIPKLDNLATGRREGAHTP